MLAWLCVCAIKHTQMHFEQHTNERTLRRRVVVVGIRGAFVCTQPLHASTAWSHVHIPASLVETMKMMHFICYWLYWSGTFLKRDSNSCEIFFLVWQKLFDTELYINVYILVIMEYKKNISIYFIIMYYTQYYLFFYLLL